MIIVTSFASCLGSKQQCLNELDLVRRLRDNKENLNSNANLGASITTVSSAVSTQGKISIANSDRIILETTVSDSVADIIPIQADILNSSSTVSSRTKQMSSCGLQILNHSLNTISVESSAQPSGAPRILTPSSAATPKAKVGSNLQNFHTDPLTDLADRLTEIVEDIIPTDDNVCEWICTLYDTIQRQTNLEVAFDQEALKLDIPSVVLKTCVNLSKPPTSTAHKLFQQICHQELAGYKSSSDIPSIKMDAIHSMGKRLFGHIRWDRKTIKTSLQNWIAYDTMVNEADQYLEDKQSHLYIENDDEQKNGILLMKHEDEVSDECEIDDILQCNLELNEQQDKTLNGGNEREYDEIDIAVCLITIKTRYSLTFECVNGVRKLFIALKVKNVPSSIYHIRELVNTNGKSTPTSSTKKGCTTSYKNYTVATISMSDIYHGNVYRSMLTKIQLNKTNLSLTLMMNVDGVAIGNNTEEPLWIITFTINEIKRGERFRTHNIIIGGVWSCYTKSNRKMMQFLLKSIVEQLKQLQKRHLFQVKACNNEFKLIQMYLIDACNDKPANSLVQNIAEPIGKYGCSRCELPGQLAAATNGTKTLPREIENNLELIKKSSAFAHSYCTTSSLYSFISEIQGYQKTSMNISGIHQTQKPISTINQNEKHELCLEFGDQFLLYNKCAIKGTSFTTRHYSKSKPFQDCGVLYQYNDRCCFGIINKVILIAATDKLLLQIHLLFHNEKDQCSVICEEPPNSIRECNAPVRV
ncbi:unnamed protein product [Rotaria magnacalcarata]